MTPILEIPHQHYLYCDTGVPHLVFESAEFARYQSLKEKCKELRNHSDFFPKGTNVTIVSQGKSNDEIYAVSYERGVEDFTLACGTGAVAAAFFNLKKRNRPVTLVHMPGGDLLINLENQQQPTMTGSAELLGEFIYESKL
jgi:diaminopimelate epimerase